VFPTNRCKGNNARRTLVLSEQKDFEENGPLLVKILRAVELDFEQDVSFILMQDGETLSLLSTPEISNYDNLILFGIKPAQIGLASRQSSSLLRLENHTIIVSGSLNKITQDAKVKKDLWAQLKAVFKS
jgi:DNA polymerase III psi subunit